MKTASYEYILKIAQGTNILPVTSACTTGCVFCSHRNNPPGMDTYCLPALSFEEIEGILEFMDGRRKIVIGESASRIIEGEPFLREDIIDILRLVRRKFPKTLIEITTSGIFLTEAYAEEIRNLQPVEINLSLNSSSERGRKLLFKLKDTESALESVNLMEKHRIPFNGSIVALPEVVGYEDIEETIAFLSSKGAMTVRVFVPGFSNLSSFNIDFFAVRDKLQSIADSVYEKYKVPVLVEPPGLDNLEPGLTGIIRKSPAADGGLLKGDIILTVDGYEPLTRVDAYNALYGRQNPKVRVKRGMAVIDTVLKKEKNTPSGGVFYYDIHPDSIYDIEKAVNRNKSKKPLIVTSELACNIICMGVEKLLAEPVDIYKVPNRWFGGSIMCTGLLTVEDIILFLSEQIKEKYDLIILPPAPFDTRGRDICGHNYSEIEEKLKIKTVIA